MNLFLPALAASLLFATTAAAQDPAPPAPPAPDAPPPAPAAEAPPATVEAHVSLGDTPAASFDAHASDADVHLAVGTAAAAPSEQKPPSAEDDDFISRMHPGFGARVGGYGFWTPTKTIWDDCPMAGVGLFGTLDVTKHLFVEAAIDQYNYAQFLGDDEDSGMSRISVLTSGAIGLRMFPDFFIVPHIQVGAGMEWTRFEQLGQKIEGVYPLGFISMGGELNVFKHIKAGADLRFLGMAKPYEDGSTLKMEMNPAAQGLFYARYVL